MRAIGILVLVWGSLAFGGAAYQTSGGPGHCVRFASYGALKAKLKGLTKGTGRKCVENAKAEEMTCGGMGIEPATYTWYSSEKACERRKIASQREDAAASAPSDGNGADD